MAFENIPVLGITILAVAFGLVLWKYNGHQRPPLPPGPKGWPLLGNALEIPKDYPEHQFAKWGEEYGASIIIYGTFHLC